MRFTRLYAFKFLSSNAQDFIEETVRFDRCHAAEEFLSSNAQDFIEEQATTAPSA